MNLNYILQFVIGGILFTLIYHYSKNNNTVISSIIPAFPTVFFVGLFYFIYFKGNTLDYVRNSILTFSLSVVLFIILYTLLVYKNSILMSLFIVLMTYLFVINNFIKLNFLN